MSHYFENDKNLESNIVEYSLKFKDHSFSFNTDNGVFSKGELDYGTFLLLSNVYDKVSGDVLDLGCGYGPIGIILKKINNINITMSDVNKRAIHLTKMNLKKNNLEGVVIESNGFENISSKFDYIVTNPPIRVGKEILYKLIMDSKNHLNNNGVIYLVIRKQQGANSFIEYMSKTFDVNVIDKSKGFFIISLK